MIKRLNLNEEQRGITLVALVITIVILIILAVVAINAVFGDSGLLQYAQDARNYQANADGTDGELINSATEYIDGIIGGNSGGGSTEPTVPSEIVQAKENETVFQEKTTLKDEHGNNVVIPEGFKVAEDSGDTVQEGIVIEDVLASTDTNMQGSQYVWIPVGTFVKNDGTTSAEIKLGRYSFDTTDGTPYLEQDATNYNEEVLIEPYYIELTTYREGITSEGQNATAKDLAGFIESVNENGGYYIGRYEASYASGADSNTNISDYSNCKAASKISVAYSDSSITYTTGTLWNFITQTDASKVSINTYSDSSDIESDLMNSYAWDTAIVYIQEAGNNNYAIKKGTDINTNLENTGENNDEVCKINDIADNISEWTTEYSNQVENEIPYPITNRGGNYYDDNVYASRRNYYNYTSSNSNVLGFRILIYMK